MTRMTSPSPTVTFRSHRRRLLALLALGAVAGPAVLAGPASAASRGPAPVSCRQVDFDNATVTSAGSSDPSSTKHLLTVTGGLTEPAKVTLEMVVYIRQPEHWEIDVVACSADDGSVSSSISAPSGVPTLQQFQATFAFTGPLGTCGIEVVGAGTRQTFDLGGSGCAL